jgi:L-alanine-DL-glutamate epimerase-like enolase superfamily enzyme
MTVADLLALPVSITSLSTDRHERETPQFTRVTTEIALSGDGETGRGEDVTYEAAAHDALAEAGLPDLTGEYTLAEFSEMVADASLFPSQPDRPVSRHYRQWALESAALDLAVRQHNTTLGTLLDRRRDPVQFVTSMRLGDPPTTERIDALRERVSGVEFKLDPTTAWDDALIEQLADTDRVRILDLKGHYEGTDVDAPADPALYERIIDGFPDAIIEDPALTDETRPLFAADAVRSRVSWDEPIESLADVRSLPWAPDWLNIKPSRFGSLRSLFETLTYCAEHGIRCYGGGQFELGVGRGQLQLLASLFYPDGPNDIAPRAYNEPTVGDKLPASPLSPPSPVEGFRWDASPE